MALIGLFNHPIYCNVTKSIWGIRWLIIEVEKIAGSIRIEEKVVGLHTMAQKIEAQDTGEATMTGGDKKYKGFPKCRIHAHQRSQINVNFSNLYFKYNLWRLIKPSHGLGVKCWSWVTFNLINIVIHTILTFDWNVNMISFDITSYLWHSWWYPTLLGTTPKQEHSMALW